MRYTITENFSLDNTHYYNSIEFNKAFCKKHRKQLTKELLLYNNLYLKYQRYNYNYIKDDFYNKTLHLLNFIYHYDIDYFHSINKDYDIFFI